MPLFWFLVGMLTTGAIIFVLLPWLRTIPRFDKLPALPWHAPLLGLLMIAVALLLYRWLGRPDLVESVVHGAAPGVTIGNTEVSPSTGAANASSMQIALASLESRLAKGGGSADDWELLAKSYEFIGRPELAVKARQHQLVNVDPAALAATTPPVMTADSLKLIAEANRARGAKQFAVAAAAYAQLARLGQMDADTWADYADAAASAQGGKLAGAPETYIAKALALDPKHPKALWLKASVDEESGRMAAAVLDWQQLQSTLPADSQDANMVTANLRRDREIVARADSGGVAGATTGGMTVSGAAVSGEVSLSNSLRSQVTAGSTLFIVAKSVDSPGAPVAAYRESVGAWPVKFTLDDSNSMLPGRNLSSTGRVTVEARISRSGQALPASGDLRGSSGAISPAESSPLKIVIDEVVK